MNNEYKNHSCGELTIKNVGEEVKLAGWVQRIRNIGAMKFIDLRDEEGITQIVISEQEELAEIEAKNFKGNRLLRCVFYSLTVCILGSIIVIPSFYSTYDYLKWFDENISNVEIIIGAIFLMLGIIFNLFCMHMNNQGPLFGMGDDIGESKNSSKKFGIQKQLACIYPQRFPLSRVDPMGAYYLYQKLSYEHTYGRKRR